MKILVKRPENFAGPDTIGDIFLDGKWWCYSLEDEVRPAGVKIYGKTAIPAGKYKVIVDYSNRFRRELPHLLNVPGFTGIRIHGGNRSADTLGCILAGKERGKSSIWNCKPAVEGIITAIKRAGEDGATIEIL